MGLNTLITKIILGNENFLISYKQNIINEELEYVILYIEEALK